MSDKLYHDYVMDVDYKNIDWLNFSTNEMADFLKANYYDETSHHYITGENKFTLYGMCFLNFGKLAGMKYIIGASPNNIGKYTIMAALIYTDKYKMFSDQRNYITYFSTIETNKFFREKGINTELIKNSYKYVSHFQPILISGLTSMGEKHNLLNKTIEIYRDLGFLYDIRSDMENFDMIEYHEELRKKRQL